MACKTPKIKAGNDIPVALSIFENGGLKDMSQCNIVSWTIAGAPTSAARLGGMYVEKVDGTNPYQLVVRNTSNATLGEYYVGVVFEDGGQVRSVDAETFILQDYSASPSSQCSEVTAYTSITNLVPAGAVLYNHPQTLTVEEKQQARENIDAQVIGDYALTSQLPTKTSDLTNDSGYVTQTAINESIDIHNTSATAHEDIRTQLDATHTIATNNTDEIQSLDNNLTQNYYTKTETYSKEETYNKSEVNDIAVDAINTANAYTQTVADTKVDKNIDIVGGTYPKITYDSKGLVVSGENLQASDIPTIGQGQVSNLITDLAGKLPFENIKNAYDNSGDNVYSTNYVNGNFSPLVLSENLYFNRTSATLANLLTTKPSLSSTNYLTLADTTNTTFNWDGTEKYIISRTTESIATFDKNSSLIFTLPIAFSRNASVEFGAKILIGGIVVSSNQVFGINKYDGDEAYSDVYDKTFSVLLDLIPTPTSYPIGTVITIEIYQRQETTPNLTTRIYCGANQGGNDRYAYMSYNLRGLVINTSQIADGAITIPKLATETLSLITGSVITDLTSTSISLTPEQNTTYKYGTLTALDLVAIPNSNEPIFIYFTSGATATTLSYPSSTTTLGYLTPVVNKSYLLSIFNGVLTLNFMN